eukprot:CAMPEP_0173328918 /NCGR_PEP_ID=MMETSP1144-20121109/2431_1 /TAXON_ID=483371 /ORGANISM="non described non described, Strain CCMP2298" /LENGTH=140 /DNA_ID=CAMNT_0014273479 /DNA_START=129 /DNA_END=548 /DNA_ORIENTATION=-
MAFNFPSAVNNLAAGMDEIKISGEDVVDEAMLGNLLKMMQSQSISSLSVGELVQRLSSMKVDSPAPALAPAAGYTTTPSPQPTPNMLGSMGSMSMGSMDSSLLGSMGSGSVGSPDFSFQSPSHVFTPFKGAGGAKGPFSG